MRAAARAAAARARAVASGFDSYEPALRHATRSSQWALPAGAVALYLAGVAAAKRYAARRAAAGAPPLPLRRVMACHSFALSAVSLALFVMMVGSLVSRWSEDGLHGLVCSSSMVRPGFLWVLYNTNYALKYYELLDTLMLALRNKPTPALHVYHHAATLLLCYVSIAERLAVQWVPISINLFVHVVMYSYYGLQAMGCRVWWKQCVTVLQIAQFVVDLVAVYYASALRITRGPDACEGTLLGAFVGMGILTSYLVLFVGFYRRTYAKPKAA